MCGRFASFLPAEAIARIFGTVNQLPNLAPSWNVAPTNDTAVIRRHRETGARHFDPLTWGHGIADSGTEGNKVRIATGMFQPIAADDVAANVAEVALAAPRNAIVEIAGPERAPFNEIVARYLKAVGDPREVVRDPEARYFGGLVEERSLVPLGEARLGRISLDEWLRRSQTGA